MPETNLIPDLAAANTGRFKEAVCIAAGRIFDSCSDKDCLEDLQVFFTYEGQTILDSATLIKCKSAEVMDVYLTVEPVPFNRGFYSVDITFYFRVQFSTYTSPVSALTDITGLAYHSKKVILYGSEGNVKTFRSDRSGCPEAHPVSQMPTAAIKCVDPISLACRIVECCPAYAESCCVVPGEVAESFGGELLSQLNSGKTALVTLGLFTVVTLERDVQLMVPCYDYSVPEKECMTSISPEDPCEMFRRIKFPVQEFFPETLNDSATSAN